MSDEAARVGHLPGLSLDDWFQHVVDKFRDGLNRTRGPGYDRSVCDQIFVYFCQEIELLCSDLFGVLCQEVECMFVKQSTVVEQFDCLVYFLDNGSSGVAIELAVNVRVLDVFQTLFCVGLTVLNGHHGPFVGLFDCDMQAFAQVVEC